MRRAEGPPQGVAPAELFARMVEPCPVWPLDVRLAALPGVAFAARAIRSARMIDAVRRGEGWRIAAESLTRADTGALVFSRPESILLLDSEEYGALRDALVDAFRQICPTYQFSDWTAWHSALEQGVTGNYSIVTGMMDCIDVTYGPRSRILTARADRYFGIPMVDLLDGHKMAFSALREWMRRRHRG